MKVKILVPFRFEVDRKVVEFEPGIANCLMMRWTLFFAPATSN